MCLGEYGVVVELLDGAQAIVRFADGSTRAVSLAVLLADDTPVGPGATVAVSIGMALHLVDDAPAGAGKETLP